VFAATLYTLNKFNADSELIVMSAAGVPPGQLLKPFLVMGMVGTLLVGFMTIYVMPSSFRDLRDMITRIRADFLANVVKEGRFTNLDVGITFHYRERSGDALLGIFFQDRREEGRTTVYIAERGQSVDIEGRPFLVLETGTIQRQDARTRDTSTVTFERYGVDLSSFGQDGATPTLKPRERSTFELLAPNREETYFHVHRGRFRAELHDRFIGPLYVLSFMLIGFAALGKAQTTRQGRGFAMGTAVIAVLALRIAGFALSSLMARSAAFVPVGYLLPLGTVACCLVMIFAGHRLEPLMARLRRGQDFLATFVRQRVARAA
jgi:lipopolysaccharide export system permease protein